jgi:hypothetical protein
VSDFSSPTTHVHVDQVDNVNVDQEQLGEFIEALPAVIEESKRGYKTTEFWVGIIGSALVVLNGIPLPEKYEGLVVALFGASYILSRGIAKKGVPYVKNPEA